MPGGLPSLGSHRVGHDWSDLVAAAATPPKAPRQRSEESLPRTEKEGQRGADDPRPSPGPSGRRGCMSLPLHQVWAGDRCRWRKWSKTMLCPFQAEAGKRPALHHPFPSRGLTQGGRDLGSLELETEGPRRRKSGVSEIHTEQSPQWIGNSNLQLHVCERYNFTFFSPYPFFAFFFPKLDVFLTNTYGEKR